MKSGVSTDGNTRVVQVTSEVARLFPRLQLTDLLVRMRTNGADAGGRLRAQ